MSRAPGPSKEFIYSHREKTFIHGHFLSDIEFFPNNPLHIFYLALAIANLEDLPIKNSKFTPIKVDKIHDEEMKTSLTDLVTEIFEDFRNATNDMTSKFKEEIEIANQFITTYSKREKKSAETTISIFNKQHSSDIASSDGNTIRFEKKR